MTRLLLEGLCGDQGPVATFCDDVHRLEDALWTFARVEGVEPTNNHIEQLLHKGVLWRKRSFGCSSASGCRFVERILTVAKTLRLQNRRVLDFLQSSPADTRCRSPCKEMLLSRVRIRPQFRSVW